MCNDQAILHGINHTVLELPCGSVEPYDKSPLEAAKRELLEETGFGSDDFTQLCKSSPNLANHKMPMSMGK